MTAGLSPPRRAARPLAAVVALSAWFGLAVQFGATASHVPVPAAAWILARYFTIWVGLAVAIVFTGLALRRRPAAPALLGGLTLNGLLVAIVYHLLLAGRLVQTGPERLADLFLHGVTPALVIVHWLLRAAPCATPTSRPGPRRRCSTSPSRSPAARRTGSTPIRS